jgi:hypothetical protein
MKPIKILLLQIFLGALTVSAQEYATYEELLPSEGDTLVANYPIDVTKESTTVTYKYYSTSSNMRVGDMFAGITYMGYNPGKELTRHIKVWMWNSNGEKDLEPLFDGDCVIPSGGSADEHIPLLNLEFSNLRKKTEYYFLYLTIESVGEVTDTPLYFEHKAETRNRSTPVCKLKIMSEVKYLVGMVKNQDGCPVAGAELYLHPITGDFGMCKAVTDEDGHYTLRVNYSNFTYPITVSAPGCAKYEGMESRGNEATAVMLTDAETTTERNFTLYDKVVYKKDRRATIILPVAPDPNWGEYFRLARRDTTNIIFELEESPQANVPYVIFPNRDFELNINDYDLEQEPGKIELPFHDGLTRSFQYASFYGSYMDQDFPLMLNRYYESVVLFDETPDCTVFPGTLFFGRVGPCRAFLQYVRNWPTDVTVIFDRNPSPVFNGIGDAPRLMNNEEMNNEAGTMFDLQGRRINSDMVKSSNGQIRPGVYIRNGKKIVKK